MEDELAKEVDSIIRGTWELRNGQVIPDTQDIKLSNDGVKIQATVLYSDLADSTELALYSQELQQKYTNPIFSGRRESLRQTKEKSVLLMATG